MKYLISLVLGLVCGTALFMAGLYYNPLIGRGNVSPLAASDVNLARMSYSAVTTDSIAFSNDGKSISHPFPRGVAKLWEPAINDTQVKVTRLVDDRGEFAGIGIKISSPSEKTRLFRSEILVNSVWHLYLPGQGTLAINQTENYWAYLRDIVIPAWRNVSDNWRGDWSRNMTSGPGALGTARVTGLGGEFYGLQGDAMESLSASAYSLSNGPAAMTGVLSIALDQRPPAGY
jgi:hypothetical protein